MLCKGRPAAMGAWFALALILSHPAGGQEKMDLEALLARHAASLKKPEIAHLKSRTIEGTARLHIVSGGSGSLEGTFEIAAEGAKRRWGVTFGNSTYDHELVISNGERISVDNATPSSRSALGQFLLTQDQLFQEGLFGGTYSPAWPLTGAEELRAKLSYDGLKKQDGKEFHVVRYRTVRKSRDVEILMYFEPETFLHRKTIYRMEAGANVAMSPELAGETGAARQQTNRVLLEEEFGDFRTSQGYVVPAQWKVRLTTQGQQSRIWEWHMTVRRATHNGPVDAAKLEVR